MAAKRSVSREPRLTKTGSNAMEIQRVINRDYKILFQDYKKLSVELWRMPATKYVLGGIAITSLVPVLMNVFRRNPKIGNFVRTNMDAVGTQVSDLGTVITDKINDLKGTDDLADARH